MGKIDFIEISRKQLIEDYATMTVEAVQDKYGLCSQSLYNLLDSCNIPRKQAPRLRKPTKKIIIKD